MDARFFVAISIGPALLLLLLFQNWDAKRPEPVGKVRNMVFLGVACCIPAALIECLMSSLMGSLVKDNGSLLEAYVVAGATEESLKLLMVLLYVYRRPHFDEVMDGVLYTAASSLGFAMLENLLYVAQGGVGTGIVRAFTAVPLHATASGIMGYFVGRSKFAGNTKVLWLAGGLLVGIFIHGTYDWTVMSGGGFGGDVEPIVAIAGALGIPLLGMGVLWLLVKHALRIDDAMLGPQARPLVTVPPQYAPQPYARPAPYHPQQGPAR